MRLAIDCHNLEGNRTGVGRYLWNLLREWLDTSESDPIRNNIEFFLYFKNEVPQDVQDLANVGFSKPHIRILGSGSHALHKHFYLPRAAARDKIDMLFCPDYVLPFYMGRPTSHIKTAVTLHDIIYEARPNEYSWPSVADRILLKWASKQSAKKADVIFCPSNFTKSEIIKYYKVNPDKIIVTPLAPDPVFKEELVAEHSFVADNVASVMSKYNIRDKFVIFVGSIFNRRFLPQTIEAFAKFAKEYSDFQFLIIGKNHTRPFQDIGGIIKKANEELGGDAVIWKEYVEDNAELAFLYKRAYATLWLSSYEGFGLPLLESMACGTPAITSKAGSLVEVAGDSAMYINNPRDSAQVLSALNLLLENKKFHEELSQKGLKRANEFSWEQTARKTLNCFLGVVKK